ncbi:RHS repeat domain-containing protein [Candidatus Amarolinea dominans]|uniref:RHS repeat domain-containing protein n=1 Tax=Candidatus Amarolinea dominans TaxID=3140696 RepID=UPI0031CCCA33
MQDHASNQTTLTHDLLGRKTSMNDPDMGAWQYRYDAAGNLVKQRDARYQAICFYYDGHNRLVGKTYHAGISNLDTLTCSGAYAVSFSYDSTANGNLGKGRRTGMNDPSGSSAWAYDLRGRVITETQVISGTGAAPS